MCRHFQLPLYFSYFSISLSAFQISSPTPTSMRAWGARSADNPTVINRMMLRFRPIAPKPVGDDSLSAAPDQNIPDLAGRRVKRKYVRSRGRQGTKFPDGGKLSSPPPEKGPMTTLQLLRDRSEPGERKICDGKRQEENGKPAGRRYCGVDDGAVTDYDGGGSVIETWVIMESVTDKFAGVGLGFSVSDRERICDLERDTCPGFVSDWSNSVVWVNPAYRKMVAEEEEEKGFLVRLVVREEIPRICPSFACRVRVTQQKKQGQKWNYKIVPCDVWRMEFGGFAWKLDVNTALTLG